MDDVITCRRSQLQHACIYIWTNKIAGSTMRVEASSMLVSPTGVGGGSLQDPECGRSMRSHYGRSPWNFQFNPICGWHQYVNGLHHYGVEGTTACQQGSWIHSIRRHSSNSIATSTIQLHHHLQAGSDEEKHGRLHTGVASWSKHPKSSVFQ